MINRKNIAKVHNKSLMIFKSTDKVCLLDYLDCVEMICRAGKAFTHGQMHKLTPDEAIPAFHVMRSTSCISCRSKAQRYCSMSNSFTVLSTTPKAVYFCITRREISLPKLLIGSSPNSVYFRMYIFPSMLIYITMSPI